MAGESYDRINVLERRFGRTAGLEELDVELASESCSCGMVGEPICTGPLLSDDALPSAETVAKALRAVAIRQLLNTGPRYRTLERIRAEATAAG